ncbi:MAG TPA: hypothetical protein VE944_24650 [Nostoc sp.]|uniref:hypothetical protein n=1 Tax=Nostoc sp. TaxID=1180 RepID=UPI002D66AC96|nr:hypothetical protein [Nostoc sp.]HYX17487.1 hypothetical protein [Nostoc sp.]
MLGLSTPFLHINPQDFPLHILVGSGFSDDMEFAVDLPTSRWIPRIGETLILPMRNEESNIDYQWGFIVKDVVYDFVAKTVTVYCDFPADGQWKLDFPLRVTNEKPL